MSIIICLETVMKLTRWEAVSEGLSISRVVAIGMKPQGKVLGAGVLGWELDDKFKSC